MKKIESLEMEIPAMNQSTFHRRRLLLRVLEIGIVIILLFLGSAGAQAPEESASPPPSATTAPAPAGTASEAAATQTASVSAATEAEKNQGAAPERDPGLPGFELKWFWTLGQQSGGPTALLRATIAALALLIAFLTVVELWQVPPSSTSLVKSSRPAEEKETAAPSGQRSASAPARVGNLFESNFSRIVLSGLGGLAAVTFIGEGPKGFKEGYYFVLFVVFFVSGLVLSALIRGFGEAMRSRIVLSRPMATWPPLQSDSNVFIRAVWRARFLTRRFWYWVISFRATLVVFVDTTFNVLTGRNQLQTALFSEVITDLHEALLEAAERSREEVHRAVIRALVRRGALQKDLPLEEQVRVAVSLLSADGSSVYYIAWEHGSLPRRFDDKTVAWVTAASGRARWCKTDLASSETARWDPIYRKNPDEVLILKTGSVQGSVAPLRLKDYYEERAEDYEGFVVLPMPWVNRGGTGSHRRGCFHISFKKADYMDQLWEHLEHYPAPGKAEPNYDQWRGLLSPRGSGSSERGISVTAEDVLRRNTETSPAQRPETGPAERRAQTQVLAVRSEAALIETKPEEMGAKKVQESKPVAILDAELGAVLHQALEVLGHALSHFDDEVYDVYVRSRRPSAEIPR